ncbi:MAG: hypothetical protein U9N86_16970 [Bacteroidota bacterium]|nr:hypothetical protein [Bacteroidota bacterium]
MLNKKISLLVLISLFLHIGHGLAQNSVAIAKKSSVSLNLTELAHESLKGKPVADSSIWINYHTIVSPSEPPLSITAEIASGQIPEGFQVFIEVRPQRGMSIGKHGTPTGKVAMGHMPRAVLQNIGSSDTGKGISVGHQVIVSFEIIDFSLIQPGETSLYIQFTLKTE